ncbi:DMT family transporter [Gallaecimonas xiamenensis]|uniref:EamA domain-containing protein n=1 Tax=Gallaecimonas xiamenensis 3-C-1 TaxID=745411 RepID=K2JTQ4_9GAMM|nr:DMT family transporter [Gallaecimonas xiamenensis]EKE73759.1 hypothetical protein B3C1_10187 [Gallaecimonas xiamenensis 3-C-1]
MSRVALGAWGWTALAMLAFAGNSLLCRQALKGGALDAASFTTVRLVSGALMLALLLGLKGKAPRGSGDWPSALALFVYAAGFSFAYVQLNTATGALLLFGAVQLTMLGCALWRGERLAWWQWLGLGLAVFGLGALLLPGAQRPPWQGALLMLLAGAGWGAYSLLGKGKGDPLAATGGNFRRAALLGLALSLLALPWLRWDWGASVYAVLSGALASGLGYAVWYRAREQLSTATAATVQLTVPVIAALGAVVLLDEPLSLSLVLCGALVLGGVALVSRSR